MLVRSFDIAETMSSLSFSIFLISTLYCLVSSSALKFTEPRRSRSFFLESNLSSCSITLGRSSMFFKSVLK